MLTQGELFKCYSEDNKLYLSQTEYVYWFEFGGDKIGRILVEGSENEESPKWRLIAKYKGEFACHFTTVYLTGSAAGTTPIVNDYLGSWFLLGGVGKNCIQFKDKNLNFKAPMI
jgi:hypothetical protein